MEQIIYYAKMIFYMLAGLGVLVFFHELGHFLMARLSKIPVEKFSVGWGPALYKKKIGETTWQIGWFLVIGGFCKMKGQDDFATEDPKITPDSFYGRPAWARLLAVLGGPLFSYIFAVILFSLIFIVYGKSNLFYTKIAVNQGDAAAYDIRTGDVITSVNNRKVKTWTGLRKSFIDFSDKKVKLDVKRATLNVNNIEITSYDNLFKALESLKTSSSINVENKYKRVSAYFTPKLSRLTKDIKDVMLYTEYHPYIIGDVENTAPAYGKLYKGDVILSINNNPVFQFEDIVYSINQSKKQDPNRVPVFEVLRKGKSAFTKAEIQKAGGNISASSLEAYFSVKSNGKYVFKENINAASLPLGLKALYENRKSGVYKIAVNPKLSNGRYIVGIQLQASSPHLSKYIKHENIGFFSSWYLGVKQTNETIIINIKGIVKLIRGDIPVKGSVGGPIKIVSMLGKTGANYGFASFISFVALLSAMLAFFNMLPIPAVDGSHVILSIIEIIRRKNFSPKFIRVFQTIGLVTILILFVLVTYMDIFV
jgi:regulator of sigma E protease